MSAALGLQFSNATDTLPLLALLDTLAALDVSFRRNGDQIALKNGSMLTAELCAAVADHKADLLALCNRRSQAAKISDTIIRLRCEDPPPPKTRAQAVRYVRRQIDCLGAQCDVHDEAGTPTGWLDSDPFADVALTALEVESDELQGGAYPVPLPAGCRLQPEADFDPFTHGHSYSWKPL